jgi:hypothetical protein
MQRRAFLFLAPAALALAGCSSFKKLTHKNDNTVLPGSREDILPPDQYTLKDPAVSGDQQAQDLPQDQLDPVTPPPCVPTKTKKCPPASGGNDGLFGDGQ